MAQRCASKSHPKTIVRNPILRKFLVAGKTFCRFERGKTFYREWTCSLRTVRISFRPFHEYSQENEKNKPSEL